MPFQEVPARFLSCPLVGIECIMLYGNSMHFQGCMELQVGYRETVASNQALPLHVQLFAFKFARRGEEPGSRLEKQR